MELYWYLWLVEAHHEQKIGCMILDLSNHSPQHWLVGATSMKFSTIQMRREAPLNRSRPLMTFVTPSLMSSCLNLGIPVMTTLSAISKMAM